MKLTLLSIGFILGLPKFPLAPGLTLISKKLGPLTFIRSLIAVSNFILFFSDNILLYP